MPVGPGRGFGKWWQGWFGGGRRGLGREGRPENCICTACGFVVKKLPGTPCFLMPCPKCGARMACKFESEQ